MTPKATCIPHVILGTLLVLIPLSTPALADEPEEDELPNLAAVQVQDMQCTVPPDARPEEGGENLRHEWVVFVNSLDVPIDMTGWSFTNAVLEGREEPDVFGFPDGFILLPGATVTVHTGVGDDTLTDLYWDREEEAFVPDLDGVILFDSEGRFVHSQECAAFNFGCPDVTATALSSGAIELKFGFGDETQPDFYHIYRADSPGPNSFERIASVPGHVTTYVDGTVEKGATVRYIVVGDFGTARGQGCQEVEVTSIPFFPSLAAGALALVASVGAYAMLRRRS